MSGDLWQYVCYRVVVGSRAYGLGDEGSDTDRKGVYLPPADLHWSLGGAPATLENDAEQTVAWEIEKFVRLGLSANPTALEILWSPVVEHSDETGDDLWRHRSAFLSKRVADTFVGYAEKQRGKHLRRLERGDPVKPKQVMHTLRLLIAGETLLRTGELDLQPVGERDRLLAVKHGEMAWPILPMF
ncbi:MAG: nucleotidyltransferase domain-containing protein [Planctomycetota bacterium]